MHDVDICIAGGGLVGAILAAALAKFPLKIMVIEAKPWHTEVRWQGKALALNYASQQLLMNLNLWSSLEKKANPIKTVHVSERGHFGMMQFQAAELNLPALGYLLEEPALLLAVEEKVKNLAAIHWMRPAQIQSVRQENDCNYLTVQEDGYEKIVKAKLLIAADGVNSAIRQACGIEADTENYEQAALVSRVKVSHPQLFTAYERFTEDGTIALLPVENASFGLIISGETKKVEAWQSLSEKDFLKKLQETFGFRLGKFLQVTQRQIYPLQKMVAKQQVKNNLLLLGNAAHTFHPVAAQGLNLSLQDVAALAEILENSCNGTKDFSSIGVEYEKWRLDEQEKLMHMTDRIVRVFNHQSSLIKSSRHWGLFLLAYLPLAKQNMARHACGLGGRIAKLMRTPYDEVEQ